MICFDVVNDVLATATEIEIGANGRLTDFKQAIPGHLIVGAELTSAMQLLGSRFVYRDKRNLIRYGTRAGSSQDFLLRA